MFGEDKLHLKKRRSGLNVLGGRQDDQSGDDLTLQAKFKSVDAVQNRLAEALRDKVRMLQLQSAREIQRIDEELEQLSKDDASIVIPKLEKIDYNI